MCVSLICCLLELTFHSFTFGLLLAKGGHHSDHGGALACLLSLQRAIDEKFSSLEEKEKELRQLRLAVRERDHDLERLRGVLSSNEATMQVRAKPVPTRHPLPLGLRKHWPLPSFSKNWSICFMREKKNTKPNKDSSHWFHHRKLWGGGSEYGFVYVVLINFQSLSLSVYFYINIARCDYCIMAFSLMLYACPCMATTRALVYFINYCGLFSCISFRAFIPHHLSLLKEALHFLYSIACFLQNTSFIMCCIFLYKLDGSF